MREYDYLQLNEVIHSRLRLVILSALVQQGDMDFVTLKSFTGASDGNLSVNLTKLEEEGYILIIKEIIEKKPLTRYELTEKGKRDYEIYLTRLLRIIRR